MNARAINIARSEVRQSQRELARAMDHLETLVEGKVAQVGHAIESVRRPVRTARSIGAQVSAASSQVWRRIAPVVQNRWFQAGVAGLVLGLLARQVYSRMRRDVPLQRDF